MRNIAGDRNLYIINSFFVGHRAKYIPKILSVTIKAASLEELRSIFKKEFATRSPLAGRPTVFETNRMREFDSAVKSGRVICIPVAETDTTPAGIVAVVYSDAV